MRAMTGELRSCPWPAHVGEDLARQRLVGLGGEILHGRIVCSPASEHARRQQSRSAWQVGKHVSYASSRPSRSRSTGRSRGTAGSARSVNLAKFLTASANSSPGTHEYGQCWRQFLWQKHATCLPRACRERSSEAAAHRQEFLAPLLAEVHVRRRRNRLSVLAMRSPVARSLRRRRDGRRRAARR